MEKRKSLVELKRLVLGDLEYQNKIIKSMENDNNPQVKEMYNNASIRKETLEDILRYINQGVKSHFYNMEE